MDLKPSTIWITGLSASGKTTLALQIAGSRDGYLNWDADEHREKLLRGRLPESPIWVFDEIHKYRKWRSFLKGLYDVQGKDRRILVTGSARLDYYRFGGDSLQGRYHFWRMHPLSVSELGITTRDDFQQLLKLGGFPEPFFGGDEVDARRWSREYRTRLIQDDITSLEQIKDLGTLENLVLRLPQLVGSPLSINALSEDLQLNHATVSRWIEVLERMYAIFRISPFGAPRIRAVKKEQKHYHFDWTLVPEPGLRFENMVACHLLKWVQYLQDGEGRDVELRFFRGFDRGDVDFVLV